MEFIEWFPYYQEIREQFGYSTEKDQEAAKVLSYLTRRKALDLKMLRKKIHGKRVMVIGAGVNLEASIPYIRKNRNCTKIVANGAVQAVLEHRIKPDVVVTDLDGNQLFLKKADKLGAIMVVHAHGDNIPAMNKLVPKLRHIIGSTQVMPVNNVYNFGGFTDGDRSVFLAEELGASQITLVSMDLGNEIGKYSKTKVQDSELKKAKMKVARRLLVMLAGRTRSELFDTSVNPIRGFGYLEPS
ncbi:MAG: 6-hydroxymethylpterin diphosphokinase MptE-like protein [Nitrososphaeraceae archaeon]|nr:6-hydroxymethylpterin diphosphokinase MptE-like protein [Nitrososphaeraceae archaeon]